MTWQPNVNQPCSTPPPLWRSYHHTTLRGFVPKLKQWIFFNWRCQNVALYIQIREIGRAFDDSQFFVTNGVSDVKISVWRCEWLIECVQHTVGHSLITRDWVLELFTPGPWFNTVLAFGKAMNSWHDGGVTHFWHGCMKYRQPPLHNASCVRHGHYLYIHATGRLVMGYRYTRIKLYWIGSAWVLGLGDGVRALA